MSLLDTQNLKKFFGSRAILDDVTLTLHEGERVGLVGKNGAGKSTLSKVLAGIEPVDAGTLARKRDASFAYLEQDPIFPPKMTAKQAVLSGLGDWYLAKEQYDQLTTEIAEHFDEKKFDLQQKAAGQLESLGGWDLEHKAEAMLQHLGLFDPSRIVESMSGGERRRVALAKILVSQPSLAILDEPTNHLDTNTIAWLENFLVEEYTGGLLLITHDRYFLNRIATRTLELDQGKVFSFAGGYEDYLEQKAVRMELEARSEQSRQNFVRRELEWLRKTPAARTGKQKARIQRSEAIIGQQGPLMEKKIELQLAAARSGKTVIDVTDLHVELGGRTLIESLSFMLTPGERVGIVGRNGAGKTTLLRTLLGDLSPTSGTVVVGKNAKIAYFDQKRTGLIEDATVYENVEGGGGKVHIGDRRADVRVLLEKMLFDTHQQMQLVSSLSGGERARVLLAKLLRETSNLLVLDEPTNDLDVATLSAIEGMLVEFEGTALIVTHDRYFLDRVATALLVFEDEGKVTLYPGNYSMYEVLRARREQEEAQTKQAERKASRDSKAPPSAAPQAKIVASTKKVGKPLTYAERLELEGIFESISAAEERVAELEKKVSDPDFYVDRTNDVNAVLADLERAKADASSLFSRWESLEAKKALAEG